MDPLTPDQAEAMARQDLPRIIEAALSILPVPPPANLAQVIYDAIFEPCVQALEAGTINLSPDGHLRPSPQTHLT